MPGVQKPHCSPCSSMKPCCTGSSSPSCSSPSTVRISRPAAMAASTVHDFTGSPSICTTQVPQLLVSQPQCVPVRSSSSRRKCTRSIRGSTSAAASSPFTVIFTSTFVLPLAGGRHALDGAPQRSLGQLVRQVALVLGRAALVARGLALLGRGARCRVDRVVVQLGPAQCLLG